MELTLDYLCGQELVSFFELMGANYRLCECHCQAPLCAGDICRRILAASPQLMLDKFFVTISDDVVMINYKQVLEVNERYTRRMKEKDHDKDVTSFAIDSQVLANVVTQLAPPHDICQAEKILTDYVIARSLRSYNRYMGLRDCSPSAKQ